MISFGGIKSFLLQLLEMLFSLLVSGSACKEYTSPHAYDSTNDLKSLWDHKDKNGNLFNSRNYTFDWNELKRIVTYENANVVIPFTSPIIAMVNHLEFWRRCGLMEHFLFYANFELLESQKALFMFVEDDRCVPRKVLEQVLQSTMVNKEEIFKDLWKLHLEPG